MRAFLLSLPLSRELVNRQVYGSFEFVALELIVDKLSSLHAVDFEQKLALVAKALCPFEF